MCYKRCVIFLSPLQATYLLGNCAPSQKTEMKMAMKICQFRSATPINFTSSCAWQEYCSPSPRVSSLFPPRHAGSLQFNYRHSLGPRRPFCSLEKFPMGSWISLSWPHSSSLGQSCSQNLCCSPCRVTGCTGKGHDPSPLSHPAPAFPTWLLPLAVLFLRNLTDHCSALTDCCSPFSIISLLPPGSLVSERMEINNVFLANIFWLQCWDILPTLHNPRELSLLS